MRQEIPPPMHMCHKPDIVIRTGFTVFLCSLLVGCGGREQSHSPALAPYHLTHEEPLSQQEVSYEASVVSEIPTQSGEDAISRGSATISVDPTTGEYVIPSASDAARMVRGRAAYSDTFRDAQAASIVVPEVEKNATLPTLSRDSYETIDPAHTVTDGYTDVTSGGGTVSSDASPRSIATTPHNNTSTDRYSAHLASYTHMKHVYKGAEVLQNTFPQLLHGKRFQVSKVTLPGQKTFFRLKAGPYPTKRQADSACRQFETLEQYCDVTAFNGELL